MSSSWEELQEALGPSRLELEAEVAELTRKLAWLAEVSHHVLSVSHENTGKPDEA